MKPDAERHLVFAKIIDAVGPVDRALKYEDPLQGVLEREGVGEITGGGTMQNKDGTIQYVGVDIMLDDLEAALELTRSTLQSLGAPAGSELSFQRDGSRIVLAILPTD